MLFQNKYRKWERHTLFSMVLILTTGFWLVTLLFLYKNCRKIGITIFISNSKCGEMQSPSTSLFIEKILVAAPCYYAESFLFQFRCWLHVAFSRPVSYRWVCGLFWIFTFTHSNGVVHLPAPISAITSLVHAFSWRPLSQNVNVFVILLDLKIALRAC